MAQLSSHHVHRRQINDDPTSPYYCPSWYYCSNTAYIIKWIVVGAIALLLFLYIGGGYWHAKRRMARGQAPLRYHRWLISRQARERFFPPSQPQNSYGFYRPAYVPGGQGVPQSYPMHDYGHPAPPPAYYEAEAVPVYTPPSKVNPDQSYTAPPAGPPPAGYNPDAGSSNLGPPPNRPLGSASPFQNGNRA